MVTLIQALILAVGLDYRFFGDEAGLVSISIAEGVAYILLAIVLVETGRKLSNGARTRVHFRRGIPLLMKLYLLWIALAAVASYVAFRNADGLHSLKDALPGLVLYVAIVSTVTTRDDAQRIISAVFVALVLLSVLGLSQYVLGGPFINPLSESAFGKFAVVGDGRIDRPVVGTFGTPNAFAVLLAPLLLLVANHFIEVRQFTSPSWRAPCLAAVAGTLALTQAKAVFGIALVCFIGFLAARRLRQLPNARSILAWASGGAVLLASAIWGLAVLEPSLPESFSLGTMRGRVGLAAEAVYVLLNNTQIAWLGGGVDLYRWTVPSSFHVHTEYILQALMWGLGGAVLFGAVVVSGLARETELGWAVKSALTCMLLILLVESAAGSQRQAVLFLVLALATVLPRNGAEQAKAVSA